MRRVIVIAVCLLLSAAAFAQQDRPTALFVFVTNPGYTDSAPSGGHYTGAYGIALQRMFTPHISGELTVSRDGELRPVTTFFTDRPPVTKVRTTYATPIDLTARYHFFAASSWKPYAGIGLRYVGSPVPVVPNQTTVSLTAGTVWQFSRSVGLRFDGKLLLDNHPAWGDRFNGSVGLAWRF